MYIALKNVGFFNNILFPLQSYGISINGGYHSALRYSQLREFHDQVGLSFTGLLDKMIKTRFILQLSQD